MNIHELNTKAITNPAYVALDDGSDTYKLDLNAKLSTMQSSISGAESDIATAQADITLLQTNMGQAQGAISSAQGEIEDLQSDLNALSTQTAASIGNLQTEVDAVEDDITDLKGDLEDVQKRIVYTNYITALTTPVPFYAEGGDSVTVKTVDGSAFSVSTIRFLDANKANVSYWTVTGQTSRIITMPLGRNTVYYVQAEVGTAQNIEIINNTKVANAYNTSLAKEHIDALDESITKVNERITGSFYPNEISISNIAQASWYASCVVYYPMPTLNVAHTVKFSGGMVLDNIVSGAFFELFYSNATDGSLVNVFNPDISATILNNDKFNLEGTFTPTTGTYLAVFIRAQKGSQTAGASVRYTNPVLLIDGQQVSPITAYKHTSNNNYDLAFNFDGIGITRDEFEQSASSIKDKYGNNYVLFAQYGLIKGRKTVYKNVLCFGNSITKHPVNSSLGWSVERGMASTTPNTDYVALLETGLKAKDNTTNVDGVYARAWEQDFGTDITTLLGDLVSNDYDLIVIQSGENVPSANVSDFPEALSNLINTLRRIYVKADILVSDVFDKTNNANKNTILLNTSFDKSGMWATSEEITPFINKIAGTGEWCVDSNGTDLFPLVNATVWTHPSDLYFLKKANGILSVLGYDTLEYEKTVTVNTSGSYLCHSVTVVGSMVSCLVYSTTQPTATVKDASNNTISHTIKSYSGVTWSSTPDPVPTYAIVFEMPDSNVTVTIS